ncbi:MAG: ribonuclease PH [Anaerolineae bacterium]
MTVRIDGRAPDEIRPVSFELAPLKYPEGSALIRMGDTRVLCAVTVEPHVPPWRQGSGAGWLTAEYALLPRATQERTRRSHIEGGRAQEIRRLIGRSLRRAVDLAALGERTIIVDCDVLQADGGTRTASITGGYVAVALAVRHLAEQGELSADVLAPPVAAISLGVVDGDLLLDLNYAEDVRAQVDLNVVMNEDGRFIEVQGTAEGEPISRETLDALLSLSVPGVQALIAAQREALSCADNRR